MNNEKLLEKLDNLANIAIVMCVIIAAAVSVNTLQACIVASSPQEVRVLNMPEYDGRHPLTVDGSMHVYTTDNLHVLLRGMPEHLIVEGPEQGYLGPQPIITKEWSVAGNKPCKK